jgi:transcription initiation factor TFIID subunit 2
MCFVDDLDCKTIDTASLSFCSNHLLFPEEIIDPLYDNTRHLVHGLASQWIGINIIPKEPSDTWVVVGIAYFITDMFMKKLCGNNEYRYRQRKAADKVCEVDYLRPALSEIGTILSLDQSELEFMSLKAPLVLFILDRRLTKASGSTGMPRIVSKVFLQAKTGDLANAAVSTTYFTRTCEKLGHTKLDSFFQQWVFGAGCPRFKVTQRFNKKKLVVEMMIQQSQNDIPTGRDLVKEDFLRDVKEEEHKVYAQETQVVFTGPMTIRIHEADGTPYEHIVEIKEQLTKFDIPYNTKYKRLKRSRRAKERAAVAQGADALAEGQEDVLLYCLGDVLQSEAEIRDWRLQEWSKEDEDRMGQESYEWIRMDSDFEWICKMFISMPGYMYTSQLQQDRDVVAQLESVQYLASQNAHPLVSTILVRTLMDRRYFHGVRTAAAEALVKHAKEEINWVGLHHLEKAFQELFCFPNSPMTRSNDFSDRAAYLIQCTLPQVIAQVKKNSGKTPIQVKRFLFDKLKFNDNSNNEFSDCYYVSILIRSLSECLTSQVRRIHDDDFDVDMDDGEERRLEQDCIAEIDRYRRMDEWTPSYQNIYSRTALDCQRTMMLKNVIDIDLMHFLNYTRPGTLDLLRVNAFSNLVELDIFQYEAVLPWFMFMLSSDPSPYVRTSLYRLFGKALAAVAIGEDKQVAQPSGGLIIERESGTEARASDLARRQTIEGAVAALRGELQGNQVFEKHMWNAITSPRLSIPELRNLLDICATVYAPADGELVYSAVVKLRYPRYWRVEYKGNGICRFVTTEKVRTHAMPATPLARQLPSEVQSSAASSPSSAPPPRPPLRLKFTRSESGSVIDTTSAASPASPAPAPLRTFIKPPKRPSDRPPSPIERPPSTPVAPVTASATEEVPKRPQLKLKLSMKGRTPLSE